MGMSDQQIRNKTARLIRAARKLKGQKQSELASYLGITQSAVSKLESGTLSPDAGVWYQFCKKFNLNADLTYSSGFIFTKITPDDVSSSLFKINELKKHNSIKVKECIPFVLAIENLGLKEDFSKVLKKSKVDEDILIIPDLQIPIDILHLIFNFMAKETTLSRSYTKVYEALAQNLAFICPEGEKSLKALIESMERDQPALQFEIRNKRVSIKINEQFKFSLNEQEFYKNYILHKANVLKKLAEKLYGYKKINILKLSPYNYELRYA